MHSSLAGSPGAPRRQGTAGRIVYPVVSRRSGGLSLGIDLFPDGKSCNFDCPYCEVFPLAALGASTPPAFSPAELREELAGFLEYRYERDWAPEPIKDLCFSGSGEPTSSPRFAEALAVCAAARRSCPELLSSASIVVITNSTGFLDPAVCELLERYRDEEGLVIWAKLDAGTEDLFRLMSGSEAGLERISEGILGFAKRRSLVVQTMLCEVDGRIPSEAELGEYASLLRSLLDRGAKIDEVHLYTFARPTPSHACAPLGDDVLGRSAELVAGAAGLRVRAFGPASELAVPAAAGGENL